MDTVKFIEERNRMCKSFGDKCTGCPAFNVCEADIRCAVDMQSTMDASAQLAIVKEWSAAHPVKTRQSVFLEQWPEAIRDKEGIIRVCPQYIDRNLRCVRDGICVDCRREFWMQEVE